MKKLCCMIALAAISFGTICEAAPVKSGTMQTDTTMKMKKKKKMKKMKDTTTMKKDTTKM